jgi:hypothetical protein
VLQDLHPLLLGERGHLPVEVGPADHPSPVRVHGVLGPVQLQHQLAAVGPQAAAAVELGHVEIESHLGELVDRPRREPVTTRLDARILLLLDEENLAARPGEPVGGRRASGPAADHEDVWRSHVPRG